MFLIRLTDATYGAAVKLHTLLDVRTSIPVFVHVTAASVHDVKGMDELI
jgi:Transposase DDE domain